ncbi:hypothetical protein FOL47_002103, partial [Perkinsus chesapeaki]
MDKLGSSGVWPANIKQKVQQVVQIKLKCGYSSKGLEACRDWTAIDIDCCGTRYPTLRLVSGYCPSDGRITMEDCLEGLNFNFITGHHVILCCDSNAWNNWGTPPDGGSYQRRRGQVLEDWADYTGLQILNDAG